MAYTEVYHQGVIMRPVFLNLFKIHIPVTAIVSIKHRVSGVFFFFMFPMLLYMYSLLPLANELSEFCSQWWVKIALWLMISAFCYHLVAGIRHLVFDYGPWHSQKAATNSAYVVLGVSTLLMLWAAFLIWGA